MSMRYARRSAPAVILFAALLAPAARAENALGLYASGALGQANVASDNWSQAIVFANPSSFRENNGAWAARLGVRPISLFAGELEYYDFGNPSTSVNATTVSPSAMRSFSFTVTVFSANRPRYSRTSPLP